MTNTANNSAAILSKNGNIVAVLDTNLPSGEVRFAYATSIDQISGRENLLNAQWGKITRNSRILGSRSAQECISGARLVSSDAIWPEFLIME